jgi:intracellular multiplication protein IcmC
MALMISKFYSIFYSMTIKYISTIYLIVLFIVAVSVACVDTAIAADVSSSNWTINFSSLDHMMDTLNSNMPAVVRFLVAVAYVSGIWLVVSAVVELRIYGQSRTMMPGNTSFTGPLAKFLVGIALMFFPNVVNISMWTLWGEGSASVLSYPTSTNAQWDPMIKGAVSLIRVLGYISIIRGLMMYTRASQHGAQPGMTGKATVHIIGGVLAVNIVQTMNILKASLGLTT